MEKSNKTITTKYQKEVKEPNPWQQINHQTLTQTLWKNHRDFQQNPTISSKSVEPLPLE